MALLDHGGQFQQPPANAPREKTSDVVIRPDDRALAAQRVAAQERVYQRAVEDAIEAGRPIPTIDQVKLPPMESAELPAFAPKPMTREQIFALIGKYPEDVQAEPAVSKPAAAAAVAATSSVAPVSPQPFVSKLRRVGRPAVNAQEPPTSADVGRPTLAQEPTIILTDAPVRTSPHDNMPAEYPEHLRGPDGEVGPPGIPASPTLPPGEAHQPAASDTDSPSRGIPTFASDPGKKITGGFGVPGEGPADYIPLDGVEVRQVVERLLDEIRARAQDDLRFSIACSYPRVSVRVDVTIEAHGYDKPIVIPRVAVPINRTSLDTARLHADEICFVVTAARREFDEAGESETPPNRMRMELGVEIPRKQRIRTPSGGSMWVDRHS